ncbi:MAG: hypothetical protein CXZ00_12325 [Acidobacteria bacterium]|nr:MAG: hypothetical protein CXZ00_12325 [Acidobacteriota bacterium]
MHGFVRPKQVKVEVMIIHETTEERLNLIRDLLLNESTVTLATISGDGFAHAAPLYYVSDGLRIFWFSSAKSDHSIHLELNDRVSACVYRSSQGWKEIRGVQMRGVARLVTSKSARQEITSAYIERFKLGNMFRVAISQSNLYEFSPSWIRYLDNSRYFGYKFELSCDNAVSAEVESFLFTK